jgi:hypothetical protein
MGFWPAGPALQGSAIASVPRNRAQRPSSIPVVRHRGPSNPGRNSPIGNGAFHRNKNGRTLCPQHFAAVCEPSMVRKASRPCRQTHVFHLDPQFLNRQLPRWKPKRFSPMAYPIHFAPAGRGLLLLAPATTIGSPRAPEWPCALGTFPYFAVRDAPKGIADENGAEPVRLGAFVIRQPAVYPYSQRVCSVASQILRIRGALAPAGPDVGAKGLCLAPFKTKQLCRRTVPLSNPRFGYATT